MPDPLAAAARRRLLPLLALVAWLLPASARGAIEVELLTMGPGDELYTRFGHTALLVRSDDGHSLVYNYGYTDFEARGLVWRFLRGTAVFWVQSQDFTATLVGYARDDRSLFRQRLDLSPAQHAELARLLRWNLEPAHRRYRYDHFRDNCATRPRDLLDRVTGGELRRQLQARPAGVSLRTLVHQGFSGRLGILLLSDLLLGRELDRPLSVWEAGFLPRLLMEALPTVQRPDGGSLASLPDPLYQRREPSPLRGDPGAGEQLLWLLAGLVLLLSAVVALLARRSPRAAGLLLFLLTLALGLGGLLVWGMALCTALPEFRWNENLLLLWPSDLLLVGVGLRWLRGRGVAGLSLRAYAGLRLAVPLAALLGHAGGWLVQRPLSFAVMSVSFAAGLLVACHALPRSRPAARALAVTASPRPDPPDPWLPG